MMESNIDTFVKLLQKDIEYIRESIERMEKIFVDHTLEDKESFASLNKFLIFFGATCLVLGWFAKGIAG
jgi:hypothetical protein